MQVVTSTVPVSQPAYVIPAQQERPLNVAVKEIRTLSILQLVIGCLSVLFGILCIAVLKYWSGYVGFGIWTGVWNGKLWWKFHWDFAIIFSWVTHMVILCFCSGRPKSLGDYLKEKIIIGGGLGMGSAGNPTNGCLNGFHMAFNIISCCLSFVDFIIFAVSVSYFRELEYKRCYYYPYDPYSSYTYSYGPDCEANKKNWQIGVAFFTILLLCMLAEFIIALTASIYCCKAGCNGCCEPAAPGLVIAQTPAQQHTIIQTSAAAPYSNAGYLPPYQASTGYNPQQPQFIAPSGYSHAPASTNVTYAQGMPPQSNPGYQSVVKTGHHQPPPAYY